MIFKVKESKGHFCDPDRPRPKATPIKKSPEKPKKTSEENGDSTEVSEVTKTPVKITPIKGTILLGFACLIDRSEKKNLKIKGKKIVSQIKLKIPTYKKKNIPETLKKIPITKPGSRFIK